MMRAGQSGIVCDFFIYGGKHSAGVERFGVEESVLRLVEEISQRIKTIKFSSIIGSQPFHFLSNYNPRVFYQMQHCTLIV